MQRLSPTLGAVVDDRILDPNKLNRPSHRCDVSSRAFWFNRPVEPGVPGDREGRNVPNDLDPVGWRLANPSGQKLAHDLDQRINGDHEGVSISVDVRLAAQRHIHLALLPTPNIS